MLLQRRSANVFNTLVTLRQEAIIQVYTVLYIIQKHTSVNNAGDFDSRNHACTDHNQTRLCHRHTPVCRYIYPRCKGTLCCHTLSACSWDMDQMLQTEARKTLLERLCNAGLKVMTCGSPNATKFTHWRPL